MADTSDQQSPTLDLEAARIRLSGNERLLKDLAGFFVDDVPGLLRELRTTIIDRDDPIRAAQVAHGLQNLAANFTAEPATMMAAEIEEQVRNGEMNEAARALPAIRTQFLAVAELLRGKVLATE